jgi:crotonobetainyl-CoA:carnitine CoA-transferase CaiB-like acyl-CoA transferase
MSFAPLEGYRFINLTQALAGPSCSYQLELLSAEVIKIGPTLIGSS